MSSGPDIDRLLDCVLASQDDEERRAVLRACTEAERDHLGPKLAERAFAALRRDPRESANLARLAIWVASDRKDASTGTRGQAALAQSHLQVGAFQDALHSAQSALADPHCDPDSRIGLDLRNTCLQSLIHLERHDEARDVGAGLLRRCEALGDRSRTIWVHMNLADLAFRRDAPREALNHYFSIDLLLPENAPPTIRGAIAANRANALEATNRFHAAERHFQFAERVFAEAGSAHTVAQVAYNAAYAASLRGRYAQALQRYAALTSEFEALGDMRHLAHIDLDRAEIHLHLGMPEEARNLAARAEERFVGLQLKKEAAQAAFLIGRAAESLGDLERTQAAYERAERRFRRLGFVEREIGCMAQWARMALDGGEIDVAQDIVDRAERRLPPEINPLSRALVGYLQARIDLARGLPHKARTIVEDALRSCRRMEAPWLRMEGEWILARAFHADGDRLNAVMAYQRAIETLEIYRVGVPPDEYMTAFLASRSTLYEEVVALLVECGDVESAFEFTERAKSRSLVDLMAARRQDASQPAATDGTARLVHLRERLNAMYRRLSREDGGQARSARTLRHVRAEAERMEAEVARIVRDGRLRNREVASLQAVSAPDLKSVQADLEPDTTLVEYFLADDALFVFIVTRESARVVRQAVSAEDIRRWLQRFQFHLSKFERGPVPNPDLILAATRANLQELADALLGGVDADLLTPRLVLVPHGVLHHVPFHALPWGDGWVSDAFRLTYAPSAAVYGFCRRTQGASLPEASILGLPDDVAPEIAREARGLARQLGNARLFLGDQATLACLQSEAQRARILHVATHGMFRRGQPMMSAIRLADRWINLYDLYDLNVESELVVLSTCESGTAGVSDGNEILGLSRGFLYAGAPALLTTQWRVNDAATADFMEHFYAELCEHGDAEWAVHHAMKHVRETRPHPYHWAPFFLLGRCRPLRIGPRYTQRNRTPMEQEAALAAVRHR